MENYREIGGWIGHKIEEKNVTKSSVYKFLGVTPKGFDLMLEKDTITFTRFVMVCKFLGIDPCQYFIESGMTKEAENETFYKQQIERLTAIVDRLTTSRQS
jgi:hypothetical protein